MWPSSSRMRSVTHVSNNGLRVTKRTSQTVTLSWPEHEADVVTYTDSKASCMDMESEMDSQGNWFILQMKKMDDSKADWATVYKGYGKQCSVDNLDPDCQIFFRLKRNLEKDWGTEIIASTQPSQATAEELNRAVESNSQYIVTRILGNTPRNYLMKILAAHDKNGMTPLMVACHNGNQTIAKMLLSCGAPVNDVSTGVGRTPLMYACIIGKLNVVQLLDQYGCDWRAKDKSGCNLVHHAINGGNLSILRFAFAKIGEPGLAMESDQCGWTPLMRAVITSDSLDIVKFLVGKGAQINDLDKRNTKSILMAAIIARKSKFVKFLLEWGADPLYKNNNEKNCYEVARGLGYSDIAKMVQEKLNELQGLPSTKTSKKLDSNSNPVKTSSTTSSKKSTTSTTSSKKSTSKYIKTLTVESQRIPISSQASSTFSRMDNAESIKSSKSNLLSKLSALGLDSTSKAWNSISRTVEGNNSNTDVVETKYLLRPPLSLGNTTL